MLSHRNILNMLIFNCNVLFEAFVTLFALGFLNFVRFINMSMYKCYHIQINQK